jgi:hypothetical protein
VVWSGVLFDVMPGLVPGYVCLLLDGSSTCRDLTSLPVPEATLTLTRSIDDQTPLMASLKMIGGGAIAVRRFTYSVT